MGHKYPLAMNGSIKLTITVILHYQSFHVISKQQYTVNYIIIFMNYIVLTEQNRTGHCIYFNLYLPLIV